MQFIYNDGGRSAAGYKGNAGDCVTRAIAIATGKPYQEVYDALHNLIATTVRRRRSAWKGNSPRNGVPMIVAKRYLHSLGWTWTATMGIGTGCKVHLSESELPRGKLIVRVSKHVTCVIDGIIYDTFDPQRGATIWYRQDTPAGQPAIVDHVSNDRCVYGYWKRTA